MTNTPSYQAELRRDRYGLRVAALLSQGGTELPYEVAERLRAARTRALAQRKKVRTAPAILGAGGAATLSFDDERPGLLAWIGSVLPLVVLATGLVTITAMQNEERARDVAELDAAILTDDLPPAAYADPGFVQFLKSGQ